MATLQAIKYDDTGKLEILDQLQLPESCTYISIENVEDAWQAIRQMKVRGAPAIAIVGCLSLAVELKKPSVAFQSKGELHTFVKQRMDHLVTSRPTAVNMQLAAEACTKLSTRLTAEDSTDLEAARRAITKHLEATLANDVADNHAIGDHGARDILQKRNKDKLRIMTHCNTGSLATAGYGTALGIVRSLHKSGNVDRVYCTETRPYNQGSRLTAFELVYEKIPSTLICDNMAAAAMKQFGIDAVVVGADRVAANGDTANKIGTYQLAVLAKSHQILFYVAAPFSSIDFDIANGAAIPIEERPHGEMTHTGSVRTAAAGIDCWNPGFDVTPAELITGGIVTERGVFPAHQLVR
uniref:Methylthioribose-1-phosphate isomerase n=1 Tax=Scapholeberis mucronata TaxID=202097 RepID=A0A4Y7NKD0_9CRUS|nr:EOG090X08IP [Scapholeberis mucronata]SVE93698.1 EOG090X08IP [Scapholeberis mucronata]